MGLLALIALALGLGWWLTRSDDGSADPSSSAAAAAAASGADASPARAPRTVRRSDIDPIAAPRAAVTGTVRDERGQPIAGAQVCAILEDDDLDRGHHLPPHCATTRSDGTYRIDTLLGAQHHLHASAPGYLPARYESRYGIQNTLGPRVDLRAGATREGIDFVLAEGGVEVRGVIKDIAGGVIEGAYVTASGSRWNRGALTFTRSDADGQFTLWTDPPSIVITAHAEGYAKGSRDAAIPGTVVELFLTPESVVVGTVVWAGTDTPVQNALVATGGWRFNNRRAVRTDAQGHFRLEGLEPGDYKLEVSGEELMGLAESKVHVGLGQTSDPVVLEAHPAFSVRGTVLVDDESPCSYGTVSLQDTTRKDEQLWGSKEQPDGSILVEGLLPGTYEVSVSCKDHVPQPEYPQVVVTDASIDGLRWSVSTGQSIRGHVVDAEGQPVADARVSARAKTNNKDPRAQRSNSWGGRSEADGSFALWGLLPGEYELNAFHEDLPRPAKGVDVELPEGRNVDEITITMPAHGTIEGIVRDEKAEPVAGVSVSVNGRRWNNNARTNDEGRFVITSVEVGEYRVRAQRSWSDTMRAPGATDDDEAGERVQVRAGESTQVELLVESQSGRITGVVRGEGGEPIADAFVEAIRQSDSAAASEGRNRQRARWGSWMRQPVLTDEDGRFELTDLAEQGVYTVYANRKGGGEAIAENVAAGSDVELSIAQTGVLAGVVTLSGGGFPERFQIAARNVEAGLWESDQFLRTEGQWELTNLPAGIYEVSVSASEGNAKMPVELPEGGEKTDIELTLVARITVKGTLVDGQTGKPIPGLIVTISDGTGVIRMWGNDQANAPNISDTEGRFMVEDAPAGKVIIMVRDPGRTNNSYGWTRLQRRFPTEPSVQDIGTLELLSRRLDGGKEPGDLGFKLKEHAPGTEPEDVQSVVAFVRPGGPAAKAGLKVGEQIVQIDGQPIGGLDSYRYHKLSRVPAGTTLSVEVSSDEGSRTLEITAGPPV